MRSQYKKTLTHIDQKQARYNYSLPIVWLTVVLAIELIFVAGMIITMVYSEKQVRTALDRQVRLERLQGDILHLDEVLTMSARMSAASGDLRWEDRYKLYEPKLEKAIAEALALLPLNERSGMFETNNANETLVEMEEAAFEAVRKGNQEEAQRLLFSPVYEQAKTSYALGLQQRFQLLDTLMADVIRTQKRQVRIVQVSGLIGWALLLIVWFVVIKNIHHRRKVLMNTREELQRSEELLKERVHVMARDLTRVEYKERERIAQLLHDQLQQILVAARLHIHLLPETAEKSRTEQLIEDAIQASRTLTLNLSPPALMSGRWTEALEWLVTWMEEQYHLRVELITVGEEVFVDKEIQIVAFDSIRELLFNVVKHAGVSQATLECRYSQESFSIIIRDEGGGFNLEETLSGQRFGLLSTLRRVELIGGQVNITTGLNKGTQVRLEFPVGEEPDQQEGDPIRVVLVDDHAIVREGIRLMIEQQEDMVVVGESSTLDETLLVVEAASPDIILMDISLGIDQPNGIEVTRRLRKEGFEQNIIVLSSYDTSHHHQALEKLGVTQYLIKGDDTKKVLNAIRKQAG